MTKLHTSWNFNKWIIESHLDNYQDLEKFFPEKKDNRQIETATNGGYQYYYSDTEINEAADVVRTRINDILSEQEAPIRAGELSKSWSIQYEPGGWQAMHNHAMPYKIISAVLNFSDREGDDTSEGAFYAMLPDIDGSSEIKVFPHWAGKLIISEGNIFHGSYPCRGDRNIMVFDFHQEILNDVIGT